MDRERLDSDGLPPSIAGRYRIREELGHGAMGTVFRAWDSVLQREVAVKRLARDAATGRGGWDHLLREARAASVLRHPAIVAVYDAFQDGEECYLVEELAAGGRLRDQLEAPWDLARFLPFARECAEALAEAAAAGIIHCDLKPENILVTAEGRPRILDFGLAHCPHRGLGDLEASTQEIGAESPTQSIPHLEGTAAYLAPERLRGAAPDARSDLFALGLVFYEMLTGVQPYRRATMAETLAAILHEQPVAASALNRSLPREIDRLLARMLARDPAGRLQSPEDLAAWLGRIDPSPAPPETRRARAARALGPSIVILVAAIGFFAATRSARQPGSGPEGVALLVVEPFRSLSEVKEDSLFALGLTEALTTRLAGLQGVQVVTPTADPGARLALEGTVWRSRDRLRIAYRLVERRRGTVLSGGMPEGRADELFTLQDAVAAGVSSALARHYHLSGGALPTIRPTIRPTVSPEAYDLYLRARGLLQQPGEAEDRRAAAGLFARCLEIDPSFALAQAGLAEADWKLFEETRDPSWATQAEDAAQRALVMAPGVAEVRVALGTIYNGTGRPERAATEFQEALSIDPRQDAAVLGLARSHEQQGDMAGAEQAYRKAIAGDPDDWSVRSHLGAFYFRQGRMDEALQAFLDVIRLTPRNARAHLNRGAALQMLGRDEEAVDAYETSIRLQPNYRAYSNLATLYRSQGRLQEAADRYRRALEMQDNDYRVWGSLAGTLALLRVPAAETEAAYRQAIYRAERELAVQPASPFVEAMLAQYYAELRQPEQGRALAARARAAGGDRPDVCVQVAAAYELLGDRAEALAMVARGLALGCAPEAWSADPAMTALAADPEFARLVEARQAGGDTEGGSK